MIKIRSQVLKIVLAGTCLASIPSSFAKEVLKGDIARGQQRASTCFACHGQDGMGGRNGAWPILAGQKAQYLAIQMRKFQKKERTDPSMNAFAAGLTEQDILDLSVFFSSLDYDKEALTRKGRRRKKKN